MQKHRCATLMIFHDVETPLCSTVHFSDAETSLKSTGDYFPDAETPLFGTFHLFPFTKTSQPAIPSSFSLPKQLRPTLVSLSPLPLLQHRSQQLFPLLKHRQPFIFLPLLKHRLSATFPNAETPLFNILFYFISLHPIIFLTLHHRRNNSVQQLFCLFCC
jgi:hypothetical protein